MMMGRRLVFHYHIKLKQQLMLLLLLLLIIIIVLLMKSKSKSKMKMKDRCRFLPLIWKRAVVPSRTLKMKLTTDPPPGWEFSSLAHALPKSESDTADVEVERNEELNEVEVEDEGPPPGWETVLPQPPCAPSLQPAAAVSAGGFHSYPSFFAFTLCVSFGSSVVSALLKADCKVIRNTMICLGGPGRVMAL